MTANREPTADELNGVKQDTVHWPANAHRVTNVDSDGNEIGSALPENYASVWAITRMDGQPDSETLTLENGDVYQRTFTYTNNILTERSAWVKQ